MNPSPYSGPERRQTSRTLVKGITYINFEPDNGGVLSNISEGGLCFQAVSPVRQASLRIWFSAGDYRIEADGELAWTDETKKKGGLRFNSLSPEMHEQILDWVCEPTGSYTAQSKPTPTLKTQTSRALSESRLETSSAPDAPASLREFRPERKAALLGFFPGLFTGLLIAALVAAAFLLGERFGAKPPVQTILTPPTPIPFPRPELPAVPLTPGRFQQAKLEPATRASAASPTSRITSSPTAAVNSFSTPDVLDRILRLEPGKRPFSHAQVPQLELANSSFLSLPEPVLLAQPEPAKPSARDTRDLLPVYTNSSAGKYFDVGKFRDGLRANQATDALEQLGFHAIIVHNRVLWINSYHVLVGPYSSQGEVQAARSLLESRGFNPRVLQSKSRHFSLPPMTLYGTDLTIRDCIVTWELNSPDATVQFMQGKNVVSTSKGRWEKRDFPFKTDAIVSRESERGPETLLEIQSAGMDQGLVLDGSALRVYLGK